MTVELVAVGLATGKEALKFAALHTPACLTIQIDTRKLTAPQPATDSRTWSADDCGYLAYIYKPTLGNYSYSLGDLASVNRASRCGPNANNRHGHGRGAFSTVARLVRRLQIVDAISPATRSRNDVVSVDLGRFDGATAQRAEPARLQPQVSLQSASVFGKANARRGLEAESWLQDERHALRLVSDGALEHVDDLTVQRTMFALRQLGKPGVQIPIESEQKTDGLGHEFSIHHGDSPLMLEGCFDSSMPSRMILDLQALNESQARGVSATIDTERQAMFSKPKTTSFVAAAEPIDVNEKYLVKLSEIKDEGISKFADPADADPPHNLRWVFRLAHLDRTPILNIDGMPYEHHDYTSNRTGKSKTKTAKARLWAEALMGRSIEDEEIDDALPNTLREKVAVCLFEEVERGGQDGQEAYMRLRILRLSPHRTAAAQRTPVAIASPTPMPQPAPQPVAAAAGDLPWN